MDFIYLLKGEKNMKKNLFIIFALIIIGLFIYTNRYYFQEASTILQNTEYYEDPYHFTHLEMTKPINSDYKKLIPFTANGLTLSDTEEYYLITDGKRKMKISKVHEDLTTIGVNYLGFSYDKKFLSFEVCYHTGAYVIMVDLEKWEYWILYQDTEIVEMPIWSLSENKLVLLWGQIVDVYPILYDAEKRKIERKLLDESRDFYSIKLSKDGRFVDVLGSRYIDGKEHYHVIRFYLDKDKAIELGEVTRETIDTIWNNKKTAN